MPCGDKEIKKLSIEWGFSRACECAAMDVIEFFLRPEVVTTFDIQECLPYALEESTENGHLKVIERLLEFVRLQAVKVTADLSEAFGVACLYGRFKIVKYILDLKSNPYIMFDIHYENERAFGKACWGGYIEIVNLMLSLKGKLKIDVNANGSAAFKEAFEREEHEVVKKLLELSGDRKIDIEACADTLLFWAYDYADIDTIIRLEKLLQSEF